MNKANELIQQIEDIMYKSEYVSTEMANKVKELKTLLEPVEQSGVYSKANMKIIATKFFFWWYNAGGTNTEQGFDTWWDEKGKDLIKTLSPTPVQEPVEVKSAEEILSEAMLTKGNPALRGLLTEVEWQSIIYAMKKFAQQFTKPKDGWITSYQLCPKCFGEGRLNNNGVTSSVFRQCDVCNGNKTLPVYAPKK